ncbi:MAG: phage tail-type lysozyme domain-containing protein [Clostridiales Family XIII bacterium]|nr:phage tail-type lysozyme domain-containing protein [Clostridiales Family XIII bacterium]
MEAIFNKGLFRTIIAIFAIGLALVPFNVISEDSVNVPNSKYIIKSTEQGDSYLRPQPVTAAKAELDRAAAIKARLVENPKSNRDNIWNYLVKAGFTDEQTAGIMGNLRQEHGYETSGDGLAQWQGGRRAKLMSMKNPHSLKTQLDFMVKVELGGGYSGVKKLLKKCKTVEDAAVVFCNKYERPGIPAMNKRIAYAREAYALYHKDI